MLLHFHETASRKIRPFEPLVPGKVGMYVCGPTVYDRIHLGNARTLVVFDVFYRLFSQLYPRVTYVRNITDVDDKILARATEKNISPQALVAETVAYFHADAARLHCRLPTHQPRVTDHIGDIISLIGRLLSGGHAYHVDGHVIFAAAQFPAYGQFANRSGTGILAGARVEFAPYKRSPQDFVLWKPAETGPAGLAWDSPWGFGRPGWHIECSALAQRYLGDVFDFHGGGIDLIFPHHQNEIAQSCCATGSDFARYWYHVGYLTVDGEKMSKSLGNFVTVAEALSRYSSDHIRYFLLQRQPTKPLDLTEARINRARRELDRLEDKLARANEQQEEADPSVVAALCQGFNLPAALQALQRVAEQKPQALSASAALFGLFEPEPADMSADGRMGGACDQGDDSDDMIKALVMQREQARRDKDFAKADAIRHRLQALAVQVEDTAAGPRWRRGGRWQCL